MRRRLDINCGFILQKVAECDPSEAYARRMRAAQQSGELSVDALMQKTPDDEYPFYDDFLQVDDVDEYDDPLDPRNQ